MPVVPIRQAPASEASATQGQPYMPGPAPDPTFALIAAAQMHAEGRLIDPNKTPTTKQKAPSGPHPR